MFVLLFLQTSCDSELDRNVTDIHFVCHSFSILHRVTEAVSAKPRLKSISFKSASETLALKRYKLISTFETYK